ncbi:MAG: hypothetical protein IJW29_06310 [Clostridia bacterium]|nr:hypothetical protein [Clostridia bacterium]
MKLDWDWREDAKVMEFEDEHGKSALVDLIQLWCVMSEFYGELDMKDKGQRLKAQKRMGMSRAELEGFLDEVAECGLISPESWRIRNVAASERSLNDGEARRKRKERAVTAGLASGRARSTTSEE